MILSSVRVPAKNIDDQSGVQTKPQPRKIPLLDLTRKYRAIENELHRQWQVVASSMRLLNGPNLAAFENPGTLKFIALCTSGEDYDSIVRMVTHLFNGDQSLFFHGDNNPNDLEHMENNKQLNIF